MTETSHGNGPKKHDAALSPNVIVSPGFPSGASADWQTCDHDWRVNPAVVATTPGVQPEDGSYYVPQTNHELWMCVKCRAQIKGPVFVPMVGRRQGVRMDGPSPFNPLTWEGRTRG